MGGSRGLLLSLVLLLNGCRGDGPPGPETAGTAPVSGQPITASRPDTSPGAAPADGAGPNSPSTAPATSRDLRFNAEIPGDFPDFAGGVDGTEFVPDPFFYGESSWEGLRLRLLLYLTYQHKDLAVLALRQGDTRAALEAWEALSRSLRPVTFHEPLMAAMHHELVRLAHDARIPLLIRLGRLDEASALLKESDTARAPGQPGPIPAETRAWQLILTAALAHARGDQAAVQAGLEQAWPLLNSALEAPPWRPSEPAHTSAPPDPEARHRDRLARLQAWRRWFNPMSTREVWGDWSPEESWREAWIRAVAVAAAGHASGAPAAGYASGAPASGHASGAPASEREALKHRLERLGALGLRSPLPAGGDPLSALEAADRAIATRRELEVRTDVALLQGLPNGDSYIDLLGQAGSPAVGTLRFLWHAQPEHRRWTEAYVAQINSALEAGKPGRLAEIIGRMIGELEAQPYKSRYYNLKRLRNEAIRLQALTGQYDAALTTVRGFYPLTGIDYRCPNRIGILKAIEGRLLMEAGRYTPAGEALRGALEDTVRWLGYLERYQNRASPATAAGLHPMAPNGSATAPGPMGPHGSATAPGPMAPNGSATAPGPMAPHGSTTAPHPTIPSGPR